jgi:hypothetical protein
LSRKDGGFWFTMTNKELTDLVKLAKGKSSYYALAAIVEKLNSIEERLKIAEDAARDAKMSLDQFRKGVGAGQGSSGGMSIG